MQMKGLQTNVLGSNNSAALKVFSLSLDKSKEEVIQASKLLSGLLCVFRQKMKECNSDYSQSQLCHRLSVPRNPRTEDKQ